jgi:hypothetical protein
MPRLDWRNTNDYRFAAQLNAGQWAWEFLRRNAEYQSDWRWFSAAWKRLEARYGKPPERNFQAWQRDPDAYRVVDDNIGDCRVDEDKVLIECWMGSKWGFYKFPLDPATDQPRIGEQLGWRSLPEEISVVDVSDPVDSGADVFRLALAFELDLPLRPQLEVAQRFLQRRQAYLRKQGRMQMKTIAALSPGWTLMLQLLDGQQAGEGLASMQSVLGECTVDAGLAELLAQAEDLVDGGYRSLPVLPEGKSMRASSSD